MWTHNEMWKALYIKIGSYKLCLGFCSAFKKRSEALWASFDEFSTSRDSYVHMLESFDKTMDLLGKIPLLPCLVGERYRLFTPDRNSAASSTPSESATAISSGTSFNINKSVASESSAAGVEGTSFSRTGSLDGVHDGESLPVSLLEWISAQDNRSSIEQMVLNCQQGLEQVKSCLSFIHWHSRNYKIFHAKFHILPFLISILDFYLQ